MTTILSKKDYKIIWVSLKNPEKIIIELDKNTLNSLISSRKRVCNKNDMVSWWLKDKDEWILKSKNDIDVFLNDL